MPKIFYIGSFRKIWDEEGIALAFEKLGCEVRRFPSDMFHFSQFRDDLIRHRPDFVMWAKLNIDPGIRDFLAKWLQQENIKTVCYMPDLYFGLSRQWKPRRHDAMFKATYVLSPDGGHDQEWKECGINHHLIRQGIPDEFCYMGKPDPNYAFDVVFVGQLNPEYPYRQLLIEWLRKEYGGRFKWIGKANSDEMRGHELNKLYASSKVIIGESVYSPYYWSNRIYETIGRGGFIIHPNVPGLDQEFKPYEHYIPYNPNDFKSLRQIIDHFLDHGDERERIRIAGYNHTKENYTLAKRCEQILKLLKP